MRKLWLLLAVALIPLAVWAAEINDLDNTDGSNTDRFPEGMAPSAVNDGARALEGLLSRGMKDTIDGVITTAGTSTAYTASAARTLTAYYAGLELTLKFNVASGASPTLNVDSLGAKNLVWPDGTAVASGDIPQDAVAVVKYDGTSFQVISPVEPPPTLTATSTTTLTNKTIDGDDNTVQDLDFSSAISTDAANADTLAGYDGSGAPTEITAGTGITISSSSISAATGLPRFYLAGLEMSNAADADHDITINGGECRSRADTDDIVQVGAITKQIDAAWSVGTNAGGLDTGTVANDTWYHVWMIKRSDTDVVDALFSTSVNSPTMPSNYDRKRRIGAVLTDGSANIIAFTQTGDHFIWADPPLDADAQAVGNASRTLITLSVPTGVKVLANFNTTEGGTARSAVVTSPDQNDEAPSQTAAPLQNLNDSGMTGAIFTTQWVLTNTSAQIGVRANGTGMTVYIATVGWIDRRGRDD